MDGTKDDSGAAAKAIGLFKEKASRHPTIGPALLDGRLVFEASEKSPGSAHLDKLSNSGEPGLAGKALNLFAQCLDQAGCRATLLARPLPVAPENAGRLKKASELAAYYSKHGFEPSGPGTPFSIPMRREPRQR